MYVNLKRSTFVVIVSEIQRFFQSWVKNIVIAIFTVFDRGNPPLLKPQTKTRSNLSFLFYRGVKLAEIFTFEAECCLFSFKNFKVVFLETLFLKSSTSKCYISDSFALRRLKGVSIDPKFYLVLGCGHNSIPQKWKLFRFTGTILIILRFQYPQTINLEQNFTEML